MRRLAWRHIIFGLAVLTLIGLTVAGCTSPNLTVSQTLFQTQERYTNLAAVAARYVRLPLCEPVPITRCADESVVRSIQRADAEMYVVLKAAEIARGTLDEAQYRQLAVSALARLRAVIVENAVREAIK